MRRVFCILLAAALLMSMFPVSAFAAHDSTGRPLDLTGDVYLALYIGGAEIPGEPAEHDVSGYLNLNASFGSNGFGKFAESAEGILHSSILDDVVQGTSGVWGVYSTTGGSHYLLSSSGLVTGADNDVHKPHNGETEAKIIETAISKGNFKLGQGESVDDYTIVWYVIKYQRSDSAWHIDGVITKKDTYSVNYYGNGNTSGGAPTGAGGLKTGDAYTVLGNTGGLRKVVGGDTYIFNGWNTAPDGTGTHYDAGDEIIVDKSDVTLYAEWYLQNKYTVTVVSKLDGTERNIEDILGEDTSFYVKLHTSEGSVGDYLPLTKGAAGTYTTNVTQNGAYHIWAENAAGEKKVIEGYQVTIYNQNGRAELQYYSVSYNANADSDTVTWSEGSAPATQNYFLGTPVTEGGNIPAREGYTFTGWLDQNGNPVAPEHLITGSISQKTVLTAQWEENIDLTIRVTIDHNDGKGGWNNADNRHEMDIQLLLQENGVNLPLDMYNLNESHINFSHDMENHITTYTVELKNLPQGIYSALGEKHLYVGTVTRSGAANEDQEIIIHQQYAPDDFDLTFDVVVNWDGEEEKALMPLAVNVKVTYWGRNSEGDLGWHIVTQQVDSAPYSVIIDPETGRGSGYYTVWKGWDDETLGESYAYKYRVMVTSFVMPDGRVIPASRDLEIYTPNGSGLYTAEITVEGEGIQPTRPGPSDLDGAYYDRSVQKGIPTATVKIDTYQVTFDATESGSLNGQQEVILDYQYKYPNLNRYVPEPGDSSYVFLGWFDGQGNPAENLEGAYLTGDVVYTARYSRPFSVEGNVTAAGTYELNGKPVNIKKEDRINNVMVVLQKQINGQYVDVASCEAPITYESLGADGVGRYSFTNIAQDGAQYRIAVLGRNYEASFDNESDADLNYSPEEYTAVLGDDYVATVHAYLEHAPESYVQQLEVDASQISEAFRPTGALAEILYRDVGDIHPYGVISQHTVEPYGKLIELSDEGFGSGSESVWQYHTDGTLYEYQMNVTQLYGNVPGVFTPEGTGYNSDTAPFTIEYDPASRYSAASGGQARTLKATLIPKTYKIVFDMGLKENETVSGMDQYLTDSITGESYIYHHTWSESAQFSAYPYRPGYVFDGWECENGGVSISNGGQVVVGAELAEDLVLVANWREVTGTSYVVRYLEQNTNKPLKGALVVDGLVAGTVVTAGKAAVEIKGYNYAAAEVDGVLYTVEENAQMTVKADAENVMIIYYLPDGSNGYTDQVESNLKLDKQATLEDNGTYTIHLETYTLDNPVTTLIQQDTPLDIVLVLDQSGSIVQDGYLDDLQMAVDTFVEEVANHGRYNEVDHRIAVVGYAGDQDCDPTSTKIEDYPIAGGNTREWVNTGVFDSNGDFYPYPVTGFYYTPYSGKVEADGVYYTKSHGVYLLMDYHSTYHHLITEAEAWEAVLNGTTVYGYIYDENDQGKFVELTRNPSGLWLYGDKQLYSAKEFFTYHTDVWTHRDDLARREIHAYGTGSNFSCVDGHDSIYTRTETRDAKPEVSIYYDALVPVSFGVNGSGRTNPNLIKSTQSLGSNGGTYVQYGIEMANKIFEANPVEGTDRVRVMVMFTDGLPGTGTFDKTEANAAIEKAYITKHTHEAYVYTIGLYSSAGVNADSDIAYYMNAVSSNYPDAQSMDSIKREAGYVKAEDGKALNDGTTRYALYEGDGEYYQLKYGRVWINRSYSTCWYISTGSSWNKTNIRVSTNAAPVITNNMVGSFKIYEYRPAGYKETAKSGYYSTTESAQHLEEYFVNVMEDITTNITTEIILHSDTILRDIMGQGLVLTENSVITAYKINGAYNENGEIQWEDSKQQVAKVSLKGQTKDIVHSSETTDISYKVEDGTIVTRENVPYISVYNLNAANATNPNGKEYHPHTVDITGYDFETGYITPTHPGYKLVAEITCVEATDDVQWGRSTATNNEESGLWLPKDAQGDRKLLLPFDQPTTIFVERAYVLDYGKSFDLSGWYFDDEKDEAGKVTQGAEAIHLDCDIENGMNYFGQANKTNAVDGAYGNTEFGNVEISGETVTYTPTSMNWGGYDSFYVFGETWRKTVLAQDANENGNLWNKVTVIPANNIYYEDSFVTQEGGTQNGFEGFDFAPDVWITKGEGNGNTEIPEHLESAPYGDVHGWTDSLGNDVTFTDGSAHFTNTPGASVQFTFTGTGVEVYTRTNDASGMVFAELKSKTVGEDGKEVITRYASMAVDNLAVSGGYYQVPTVAFKELPYGTYTLRLIATIATGEGGLRKEYCVDGVRIHNPLGNTTNYYSSTVKDAYGLENNAVITEVRDILIDKNNGFDADKPGFGGAVFIDHIKSGQGLGDDQVGEGKTTFEIGTFEDYGPKNEVYLSAGQAIVLKVAAGNNYYVGLKSLKGDAVTANVSGVDRTKSPTAITITHTTDMYYRIHPVDGYIVIQNGNTEGQALLSITNLRTTNMRGPVADGGVVATAPQTALLMMRRFSARLQNPESDSDEPTEEAPKSPVQIQTEKTQAFASALFVSVRQWLDEK